jgi:hypothetical protein
MGEERDTTMMVGWRRQYKTTIKQKLCAGNHCKGGGNLDV